MAASVAGAIPAHYKRQFEDTFEHTIQQDKKKLADKLTIKNFPGKEKVYTDLEELSFVSRGRLQNSNPVEVSAHKRKLTKAPFMCQVIFDRSDDEFLAELGTPDSEVVEAMRMAWNRELDTATAVAAKATVYGGTVEPYVDEITLPASQLVAVNYVHTGSPANSGLTPYKLIRAMEIFETNEIYPEEREICLALNPKAKRDLIIYVEAGTNEVWTNMIAGWLDGTNKKLFGFTPILTNRLETNSGTDIDTVFAYEKGRGIWMADDALEIKMDVLPTKQHALQISAYGQYGFMRRYEKTVVTIECDRTP